MLVRAGQSPIRAARQAVRFVWLLVPYPGSGPPQSSHVLDLPCMSHHRADAGLHGLRSLWDDVQLRVAWDPS